LPINYFKGDLGNQSYIILDGEIELVKEIQQGSDGEFYPDSDYKDFRRRYRPPYDNYQNKDCSPLKPRKAKPKKPRKRKPADVRNKMILHKGVCFGEDVMKGGSKRREYSAYATLRTLVVVIPRACWEKYHKIVSYNGLLHKRLGILRRAIGFREFSDTEIFEIYKKGKVRRVSSDKIIFNSGQVVENLFVILQGTVKVIKKLEIAIDSKGQPVVDSHDGPSNEDK
jgi:CRP-like cAMP-binding protein